MSTALDAAVAQRLESGELELPLVPELVPRLLVITQDPDADIREMEALVCQDPALAAHVLRVANAPAFVGQRQLTSIREAITRIGTRTLIRIAITARMSEMYWIPAFEHRAEQIWQHARLTGVYAVEISRRLRTDPDEAFLCGLLHSIGQPVVLRAVVSEAASRGAEISERALDEWLGTWSRQVGVTLASSWNLPPSVQATVAFHDRPDEAPSHRREVLQTSLATMLASCQTRSRAEQPALIRRHPSVRALSLEPDPLVAMLSKARLVQQAEALAARPGFARA